MCVYIICLSDEQWPKMLRLFSLFTGNNNKNDAFRVTNYENTHSNRDKKYEKSDFVQLLFRVPLYLYA